MFIRIAATEENNFTGRLIPVSRIVDIKWSEVEKDGGATTKAVEVTLDGRPEPITLGGGDAVSFMAAIAFMSERGEF